MRVSTYNKSKKTTSSLQIHAAHKATVKHGTPWNRKATKCDKRKRWKINNLHKVLPLPSHSFLDMTFLQSKPVFFSGTSQRVLPNPHPTSDIILSATEDLHIINTVKGTQMELASGDTVFILVPRHDAIVFLMWSCSQCYFWCICEQKKNELYTRLRKQ